MLLRKYLELVNDLYAEPENEEILGSLMFPCTKPKQLGPIPKNMEQVTTWNVNGDSFKKAENCDANTCLKWT